jgi:selenocysteine lyase/cysteine desulfurase
MIHYQAGGRQMNETDRFWSLVRDNIIGRDAEIQTPFGTRRVTYADYTASGRGLRFIERYMERMLELYGNTHTEDDATGIVTSRRLRQAETAIKRLLHAGDCYKIIEDGTGTTGAVHRLQQILGLYIPPAGKDLCRKLCERWLQGGELARFEHHLMENRPVVFVGPYEHHSNEVSWRECFAEVVEIELDGEGLLDLEDLERKLSRPEYRERRIGAFSAASNVSGLVTPVYEVARILHRHDALAFFDFAAIAPYARIDVCHGEECFFDGIYFSPHKLLGGPGTSGILIIRDRVYRHDLPPTVGAGGTVEFVNFREQEYSPEIEVREKPGTPGILQTLRAALALQVKERLGPERIEERERELARRAMERLWAHPAIEIIGNPDPRKRIPIFSFNIRAGDSHLHARFVTVLLNDLFGIQSRAGCSCAGPYGHRVLHIDEKKSLEFKHAILEGHVGVKPGWARVNFHFLMTDEELDFLCAAILFVAENGKYFLPLYEFELATGSWRHRSFPQPEVNFGLEEALAAGPEQPARPAAAEAGLYRAYLEEARRQAEALKARFSEADLATTERDLMPFVYAKTSLAERRG